MRFPIAFVSVFLAACPVLAGDYFLGLTGIKGESSVAGLKDQVPVLNFSFGLAVTSSPSGGVGDIGTLSREFSDLSLSKILDRTSPTLLLNCAGGAEIPSAVLSAVETVSGTNRIYFQIELSNVRISSVSTSGGSGERPVETLTFRLQFDSLEILSADQCADRDGLESDHQHVAALANCCNWHDAVRSHPDHNRICGDSSGGSAGVVSPIAWRVRGCHQCRSRGLDSTPPCRNRCREP